MAAIDDLIDQIEDGALRKRLKDEVARLAKGKKFGLVFEEHLPELTLACCSPIRRGSIVALRGSNVVDMWRVLSISGEKATCINRAGGNKEQFSIKDLAVVRQFGQPIFPSLIPIDKVKNGGDKAPWHTLIEADNFHALQLLEYLYAGKVDCIYIDPPYNTGARDWKYNNDYVDINDRWRHSKWLAMMRRRLILSKRLLKSDGVLIVTIDDNELYHLGCLLNDIFPEYDSFIIGIEHNKRGRRGKNFAKSNEFAIFIVKKGLEVIAEDFQEGLGGETRNLRRTGSGSLRRERRKKYYPIYIDKQQKVVLCAGDPLLLDSPTFHTVPREIKDRFPERDIGIVWPIDEEGVEKNWHYGVIRTRREIDANLLEVRERKYGPQVYYTLREKKSKKYKTFWSHSRFDASTHGTELVESILQKTNPFDYPKSLYAELECLKAACFHKKEALVVDFFAGSGTTLHALNLLNLSDNGNRRCILITNNEVSEADAAELSAKGYRSGDPQWEERGICRSVTWLRSKYAILGQRDDKSALDGECFTGRKMTTEKPVVINHLGFVDVTKLKTVSQKKQIVALISAIPQSEVKKDSPFILSDKYSASILFDPDAADDWIEELEDYDNITEFYIVTPNKSVFSDLKARIEEIRGSIVVYEDEKRAMKEGLPANLEYFRLDFLEKNQVALGRRFREILPLLWLRAGAIGPRPALPKRSSDPDMLIPDQNTFAVLLNENYFAKFQSILDQKKDITHVFIVTDSDEAFREMAAQINVLSIIQLYRDYLENFIFAKGNKI